MTSLPISVLWGGRARHRHGPQATQVTRPLPGSGCHRMKSHPAGKAWAKAAPLWQKQQSYVLHWTAFSQAPRGWVVASGQACRPGRRSGPLAPPGSYMASRLTPGRWLPKPCGWNVGQGWVDVGSVGWQPLTVLPVLCGVLPLGLAEPSSALAGAGSRQKGVQPSPGSGWLVHWGLLYLILFYMR